MAIGSYQDGLDVSKEDLTELLRVDSAEWREELPSMHEHFARFGEHLPPQLRAQLNELERRLDADE